MNFEKFEVTIPGHKEVDGYVKMRHGEQYEIRLRNYSDRRCDAEISIDGQVVGKWRIEAYDSATLKRPAHDRGHFTFYKAGSADAQAAGLTNTPSESLGLISVTFTPEIERFVVRSPKAVLNAEYSGSRSAGVDVGGGFFGAQAKGLSAGGTGLSGDSGQEFGRAGAITYDYSGQRTLHLRLVHDDSLGDGPRPMFPASTPVPPPIG